MRALSPPIHACVKNSFILVRVFNSLDWTFVLLTFIPPILLSNLLHIRSLTLDSLGFLVLAKLDWVHILISFETITTLNHMCCFLGLIVVIILERTSSHLGFLGLTSLDRWINADQKFMTMPHLVFPSLQISILSADQAFMATPRANFDCSK